MRFRFVLPLSLLASSLHPMVSHAQWLPDGVPVSTAVNNQQYPTIVSDGAGGAIVTWQDQRNGTDNDIYVERIDASGAVLWTPDGVPLCTAPYNQLYPTICPDGAGGAIVTWHDIRTNVYADIYAQRVDASGVVQWTANGVGVCKVTNQQYYPTIVSDGAGGAIVTWYDYRGGSSPDIYAQRIDASGAAQWTANGVALCTATNSQMIPQICSDGAAGAIVTWDDARSGTNDIYAQRINAAGAVQWAADGVALCTAANAQYNPEIVPDGAGGAIVTWYDVRNGNDDIYAQRIDAAGAVQWTADGVALCTALRNQSVPMIAQDGAGGAIVTWEDYRGGLDAHIYAQRINAAGAVQWTADGVALCTAANNLQPTIAADGAGGAIVSWEGNRNGTNDIFAQRINAAGAVQWTADGVALCIAASQQYNPEIVSDGGGGAIVTWDDFRVGAYDVYAQRVGPGGLIPTGVHGTPSASAVALSENYPNPFSTGTAIELTMRREQAVRVEVFDAAGRRVREIELGRMGAGESRLTFDGLDDHAHALPSGVYFYRVHAGSETVTRKMVIAR